jgi:hypothetical protein
MMNVEGEQGAPVLGINFLLPDEIKHELQNFVLINKKKTSKFEIPCSIFGIRIL